MKHEPCYTLWCGYFNASDNDGVGWGNIESLDFYAVESDSSSEKSGIAGVSREGRTSRLGSGSFATGRGRVGSEN